MHHRSGLWSILFFESSRGEQYVETFIRSLDPATIAKVVRTIDLLERYGPELGMPHSKPLTRQLHELRIRGRIEVRILYMYRASTIYLLHAFQKKTQKTPQRELDIAITRMSTMVS